MPWKKTDETQGRENFIRDWVTGDWTITGLCRRHGISRKTGHKYIARFSEEGRRGLINRSRARQTQAKRCPQAVVDKILGLRGRYPHWGPQTIHDKLVREEPTKEWPHRSTIAAILKREGMIVPRRGRRRKTPPYTEPLAHAQAPNDVWTIDFKGWFHTRDGQRCDPLTVTDAYSRFLLVCRAVTAADGPTVQVWLEDAFVKYGLPKAIRSDNGAPFATTGLAGISKLAVWLLKMGITPERIDPGRPDQNGRHERFHRTLKEAVCDPPAANRRSQQRSFNRFKIHYNEERPHSALGGAYPADFYCPSPRVILPVVSDFTSPPHRIVRRVRSTGEIKWRGDLLFVSRALAGELISLEQETSRYWTIHLGPIVLGTLDEALPRVLR